MAANGDTVHAIWYDYRDGNSEIYHKRSTDGGAIWGNDTRLTNNASVSRYPSCAVAGSVLHVVWNDSRDGNSEIYYKRSTDGGAEWGDDIRLTNNGSPSEYPSAGVGGGAVHVVWVDYRDSNSEIYYKRSTNNGATWSTDTRLTNNTSISGSPSVAVAGTLVHVAWHDYRDGNYEAYHKRSSDGGATWGSDTRLTSDAASSQFPSLAAGGDAVHVVWCEGRDGNTEVYYKRSTDGGATWSSDTRLTNDAASSQYPSIATAASAVHLAWVDSRDGNTEIYYKRSTDHGANWEGDTRLTNNASASALPSVAIARARVNVVWYDSRDGNAEIYYKRNPVGNPWSDVGCIRLEAPEGGYDSGATVTPVCSLGNFGSAVVNYQVRLKVGARYNQVAGVTNHAPGARVRVTFPNWTAQERGSIVVTCSTELASDMNRANDKATGAVTVDVHDVTVKVITAPAGDVPPGAVVTPACSVYNAGTAAESYDVRMVIVGAAYDHTAAVNGHAAGATRLVAFPSWTATTGTYVVSCSSALAGDQVKANDRKTGSVTVGGAGGWTARTPMPTGVRAMKEGAWLALDRSKNVILAARGNRTPDFFEYHPAKDSWGRLALWMPGRENKPPSKGATACCDGFGRIYAVKGGNTQGFYLYDHARDSWYQKQNVPLGLSNKRVRAGASLVWAYQGGTGYPYLLKGYRNELWRYHVDGDSWRSMTDAPIGANQKYDRGSWLAYDGVRTIYAHKSRVHEFYKYDTETDVWSPTALAAMPVPGSGGTKKSKDGGCGVHTAGSIYALKGGNTQEFWKYTVATGTWAEKDVIPRGALNRRVKAGGSMVAAGSVLYAVKGNKTNELWMYTPGALDGDGQPGAGGRSAAGASSRDGHLTIRPNPVTAGPGAVAWQLPSHAVASGPLELSVCDVSGRAVLMRSLAAGPKASNVELDVRALPAGVYLVRLTAGGVVTAQQKLVVQR